MSETKTLRIDGNTGVLMITDYGTSTAAMANPMSYLNNIYFHSALPYLQILNSIKYINQITISPVTREIQTWSEGSCSCF